MEEKREGMEDEGRAENNRRISRRDMLTVMGVAGVAAAAGVVGGGWGTANALGVTQEVYGCDPAGACCTAVTIAELRQLIAPEESVVYMVTDPEMEGQFMLDPLDSSSADNTGTILVTLSGARLKRMGGTGVFNLKWFGAKGDGSSDDSDTIQAVIQYISSQGGGCLYIPKGVYNVAKIIRAASHITFQWEEGAVWRLYNPNLLKITAFIENGFVTDVTYINPQLDCNFVKGANGIGVNNSSYIRIQGGHIRGCRRDVVTGGGRAITCQFNVYSVTVDSPFITDCTSAIDFHGRFNDELNDYKPTLNITVNNPVIRDCEEAFSFYDLMNRDLEPHRPDATNVIISGGTVLNCGKSTAELSGGTTDGTAGGVIVSERARFVMFNGLKVFNQDGYGKIGGLFRGTSKHFKLLNIGCHIDAVALLNLSPAGNLAPVTAANYVSTFNLSISNVSHSGSLDYVVYHSAGASGNDNKLYRVMVNQTEVEKPLYGLLNETAGRKGDSYLDVVSREYGQRISGRFERIYLNGNQFGTVYTTDRDLHLRTVHHKGIHVIGYNEKDQLVLERRGSYPAKSTLFAFDGKFIIGTANQTALFETDIASGVSGTAGSDWDGSHFRMGDYHLWVDDNGRLRIKNGMPAADSDGDIVGMQS